MQEEPDKSTAMTISAAALVLCRACRARFSKAIPPRKPDAGYVFQLLGSSPFPEPWQSSSLIAPLTLRKKGTVSGPPHQGFAVLLLHLPSHSMGPSKSQRDTISHLINGRSSKIAIISDRDPKSLTSGKINRPSRSSPEWILGSTVNTSSLLRPSTVQLAIQRISAKFIGAASAGMVPTWGPIISLPGLDSLFWAKSLVKS